MSRLVEGDEIAMACPLPLVDMHVHTTQSDGLRSLLELAQLAKLTGLAGFAVTDHDILADGARLEAIGSRFGLSILPGVELSTRWNGRSIHLLAYGAEPTIGSLPSLSEHLVQCRRERLDSLLEIVRKRLPRFSTDSLVRQRNEISPGRKHVARELVRQGFASSTKAAFAQHIAPVTEQLPVLGVPLDEAIAAIHSSGGVAVLAHPPTGMSVTEWRLMGSLPLDGIETCFGRVANRHRRFLQERAAEYGWFESAGSDFHGDPGRNQIGLHTISWEKVQQLLGRRPSLASVSAHSAQD